MFWGISKEPSLVRVDGEYAHQTAKEIEEISFKAFCAKSMMDAAHGREGIFDGEFRCWRMLKVGFFALSRFI